MLGDPGVPGGRPARGRASCSRPCGAEAAGSCGAGGRAAPGSTRSWRTTRTSARRSSTSTRRAAPRTLLHEALALAERIRRDFAADGRRLLLDRGTRRDARPPPSRGARRRHPVRERQGGAAARAAVASTSTVSDLRRAPRGRCAPTASPSPGSRARSLQPDGGRLPAGRAPSSWRSSGADPTRRRRCGAPSRALPAEPRDRAPATRTRAARRRSCAGKTLVQRTGGALRVPRLRLPGAGHGARRRWRTRSTGWAAAARPALVARPATRSPAARPRRARRATPRGMGAPPHGFAAPRNDRAHGEPPRLRRVPRRRRDARPPARRWRTRSRRRATSSTPRPTTPTAAASA